MSHLLISFVRISLTAEHKANKAVTTLVNDSRGYGSKLEALSHTQVMIPNQVVSRYRGLKEIDDLRVAHRSEANEKDLL